MNGLARAAAIVAFAVALAGGCRHIEVGELGAAWGDEDGDAGFDRGAAALDARLPGATLDGDAGREPAEGDATPAEDDAGPALDIGELPDGELPDGEPPDGEPPDGELPDGELPDGELPDGELPDGELPDEGELSDADPPPDLGDDARACVDDCAFAAREQQALCEPGQGLDACVDAARDQGERCREACVEPRGPGDGGRPDDR